MALFKKYCFDKKYLMEDWDAADEIEPLVQKILNGTEGSTKKEDVYALLKKILRKKSFGFFGKMKELTEDEIAKLPILEKHKYAADFFFIYMKRRNAIQKIWNTYAKKLAPPLKQ